MKYVEAINDLIRKEVSTRENIVLFGQNISTGSSLGGLTKGLTVKATSRVLNTQNSENTMMGVGFGLMLNNVSSIFFLKQLDFALLGMDQIVNTNNYVKTKSQTASFTIMAIIVDSGYQGIQSSYNGFGDICSTGQIPGFLINGISDAKIIIQEEMFRSGVKLIGVSQRLFREDSCEFPKVRWASKRNDVFEYSVGNDITIVCFNLSLAYGIEMEKRLLESGYTASLYNVNHISPIDWSRIVLDVSRTRRLLIIDDSKSSYTPVDQLGNEARRVVKLRYLQVINRLSLDEGLRPNYDRLTPNVKRVIDEAFEGNRIQRD